MLNLFVLLFLLDELDEMLRLIEREHLSIFFKQHLFVITCHFFLLIFYLNHIPYWDIMHFKAYDLRYVVSYWRFSYNHLSALNLSLMLSIQHQQGIF